MSLINDSWNLHLHSGASAELPHVTHYGNARVVVVGFRPVLGKAALWVRGDGEEGRMRGRREGYVEQGMDICGVFLHV